MFKIIIYSIITISIIHFVLYYFNIDYGQFEEVLNIFKSKNNLINDTVINDSINELKTLNECINNGQIDTSFS